MWRMVLYRYCRIDSNLVDAIVDDVKSQLPHMFTENKLSILEELFYALVLAALYKFVAPLIFTDTSFFQTPQWFVGVSCLVLVHRRFPLTGVWSRALTWSAPCCTCTCVYVCVCVMRALTWSSSCCTWTCVCVCVNGCFDMIRLLLCTCSCLCVCVCYWHYARLFMPHVIVIW